MPHNMLWFAAIYTWKINFLAVKLFEVIVSGAQQQIKLIAHPSIELLAITFKRSIYVFNI